MTETKKRRRWKRAARVRRKLNIPRNTFYRMIRQGKVKSKPGPTERSTLVCTGYGNPPTLCLDDGRIDCRECN